MTGDRTQWLMNYPIVLPRDYDMEIIRHRVRTRGAALDGRDGLGFKAYAIRTAGETGSTVNEYSPFYAWNSAPAAAAFLAGGAGFQGIVADFGRPAVHSWMPLAGARGALPAADVTAARRWTCRLPSGADPTAESAALVRRTTAFEGADGVHRAAAGIDPHRWELVLYVTTDGSTPRHEEHGDQLDYDVLHVSEG